MLNCARSSIAAPRNLRVKTGSPHLTSPSRGSNLYHPLAHLFLHRSAGWLTLPSNPTARCGDCDLLQQALKEGKIKAKGQQGAVPCLCVFPVESEQEDKK
eukprot:1036056-Pelagomonas_calceolata.AAC.6